MEFSVFERLGAIGSTIFKKLWSLPPTSFARGAFSARALSGGRLEGFALPGRFGARWRWNSACSRGWEQLARPSSRNYGVFPLRVLRAARSPRVRSQEEDLKDLRFPVDSGRVGDGIQ